MHQKYATCLNVSLLLAALAWPAEAITASVTSGFTITIHVYNYAAVPEKTLARAKGEAGRIFRNAGLTALWVDHALSAADRRHPHYSTDSWDGTHFLLRLLTQSREGSSKNAMGEALSLDIANVFMDRVKEKAAIGEVSASQMLGHAIAHEIGHHLLGNNSHAPHGIMATKWSNQHIRRMSKGNLLFTHQEVTRMQSEVTHRSRSVHRVAKSNQTESYSLKITVRVSNYVRVPSETWNVAEKVTAQIFDRMGIEAQWLDCSLSSKGEYLLSHCKQPLGPTDLILRLVPVSRATRAHFGTATLGIAAQPDKATPASASVFYDRVDELARGGYASKSVILGHAIAHELGHLLLGSHSHSPMGLMRAKWSREDLKLATIGELQFRRPEAISIRQNVLGLIRNFESRDPSAREPLIYPAAASKLLR